MISIAVMKLDIDKIKKEIERRGWSMAVFAQNMECPRTYPYYLLKPEHETNHSLKTIDRIAVVLDYDPKDLII